MVRPSSIGVKRMLWGWRQPGNNFNYCQKHVHLTHWATGAYKYAISNSVFTPRQTVGGPLRGRERIHRCLRSSSAGETLPLTLIKTLWDVITVLSKSLGGFILSFKMWWIIKSGLVDSVCLWIKHTTSESAWLVHGAGVCTTSKDPFQRHMSSFHCGKTSFLCLHICD